MKLSLVASLYSLSAAAMSICCKYHLVEGIRRSKVALSYRAAIKGKEYWRLGTGLLLFNLDNPLDMYTLVALYSALSALERRCFKRSPVGMITGLVFVATLLLAPGFYVRELRLKEPSVMFFIAIVTWASIRCFGNPGTDRMLLGLAPFVPMIAPHFRNGEVDVSLLKHQGMAVAAGLASVLLIPDGEGAGESRDKRQGTSRSMGSGRNPAPNRTGRVGRLLQDKVESDDDEEKEEEGGVGEEEEEEEDSEDDSD